MSCGRFFYRPHKESQRYQPILNQNEATVCRLGTRPKTSEPAIFEEVELVELVCVHVLPFPRKDEIWMNAAGLCKWKQTSKGS